MKSEDMVAHEVADNSELLEENTVVRSDEGAERTLMCLPYSMFWGDNMACIIHP